ncbi:IEC3 subunit of the Ino80 complex, chromatin re-modelling-domain-containing protein [Myxozyma melibiosi]|uniref:IEC3 subunit of the Ino80 complex, chromatin re-modelling-domain-containing protein n=1 Tax=Myxozyma melibiosi TaxID=54550 RepID=A0ABR1EXW9_9ASCO
MASQIPTSPEPAEGNRASADLPMNPLIAAHLDPIANQYGSSTKHPGNGSTSSSAAAAAGSVTASGARTSISSSTTREPYRSYRKKYRKLRLKFDAAMRTNEDLTNLDVSARRSIRRLNGENSRLLDLLIDLTESGHIEETLLVSGIDVEGNSPEEIEREKKIQELLAKPTFTQKKNGDDSKNGDAAEGDSTGENGHASGAKNSVGSDAEDHAFLNEQMIMLQNDYESDY